MRKVETCKNGDEALSLRDMLHRGEEKIMNQCLVKNPNKNK